MSVANTHYGPGEIARILEKRNSIFFIGIGGIHMSSLAHLTCLRGYRTGGSDRTESALTRRLAGEGVEIFYGHDAAHLAGYDAVVYTVAISPDNPEYRYAQEHGLPCISRADYLGYLMTGYPVRIGISGMHGKSTCTSMCAEVLTLGGADPTVLSGAELASMGGAYRIGGEKIFLFEACEYMDSFLDFHPTIAVVLNIEEDHMDYFRDLDQICASYRTFAGITREAPEGGCVVMNGDDANVRRALSGFAGRTLVFGVENRSVDICATELAEESGRYSFLLTVLGEEWGRVSLKVPGKHHIYNALATAAVAYLAGIPAADAIRGISAFAGAKRRMEYKGRLNGAPVYDDYGHHPTEVAATLAGARGMTAGRLFCVFQPHTYSRTQALFREFAGAFGDADRVLMPDIYAARETDTLGVSSTLLCSAIGERAQAYPGKEGFAQIAGILRREVKEKDTVIVMGAGDVEKVLGYLPLSEEDVCQ